MTSVLDRTLAVVRRLAKAAEPWIVRHRDDEAVDRIVFEVVPRWKSSYLSGDEWRVSTRVTLEKKGRTIYSRSYHKMQDAASHIAWLLKTLGEPLTDDADAVNDALRAVTASKEWCGQPGCANPATKLFKLKHLYSDRGDKTEAEVAGRPYAIAFCDTHSTRGDCGLQDADDNYEFLADLTGE